jgi:HEAT repeat protein/cyclophilin family peptidyl-prolyl cis-trans isomerase
VSSKLLIAGLAALTFTSGTVVRIPQQSPDRCTTKPTPLGPDDVGDIARLVMLEDTRRFDEAELARMLGSTHREVRRRAALAIARIADARGLPLLEKARTDKDEEVVATAVFATGQLKDSETVGWLGSLLDSKETSPGVMREAAIALGKFQVPGARVALARFLTNAAATPQLYPAINEALLSIGRFPAQGDLAPVLRWTADRDAGTRWRAAWALVRPRDPGAWPHLLKLSDDPSADVRFWAVRGLVPPPQNAPPRPGGAEAPSFDRAKTSARLRAAVRDPDRRVRTEALRALAQHDDDESFAVVLAALESPDTWLSVSAAEAMGRFQQRATVVVPKLLAAASDARPLSVRLTALTPLGALAPERAVDVAGALARVDSATARAAARQALGRLGEAGKVRSDALVKEGIFPAAPASPRPSAPAKPTRTESDYRRIVERWVVPDYNCAPPPRAEWNTPRGTIELELYPGDAPLGVEFFVRVVESGEIVGTEFGRVVPNFVAQQRAIRNDVTLRDEVSRRGLTRGNLSWASAGLDTGRPGYTLGVTPQPHNEGNFTSLGRIVSGMETVERLELGDRITAAKMVK